MKVIHNLTKEIYITVYLDPEDININQANSIYYFKESDPSILYVREVKNFWDTFTLIEEVKHRYSKENLYHFNCGECNKWWSISDWDKSFTLTCPFCKLTTKIEEI